jgi:hypothetical protein
LNSIRPNHKLKKIIIINKKKRKKASSSSSPNFVRAPKFRARTHPQQISQEKVSTNIPILDQQPKIKEPKFNNLFGEAKLNQGAK